MQIEEHQRLLLSDTLVPDLFILEHLPALSGLAVKIYIYALLCTRSRRTLTESDLARRMGEENDMIKAALAELAAAELIELRDRGFSFIDIKATEIEKNFRPRTTATPSEAVAAQKALPIREKLMSDIAKTFFQGLMSPSWYSEIDSYFDRFGFEPEVVYALFQECARRNKLNSKAYIAKVAENWAARGIVTYADLNRYFLSYEQVTKMGNKIGRKLRRKMTEFDLEKVARWIEQFGYDYDVIEIALRKTSRLANPSLDFADRLLTDWFANQLRDPAAVNAYEDAKAAKHAAERQASRSAPRENGSASRRNVGNFEQREYSEEFLAGLYETIPDSAEEEQK
ncbi:MAG: DnaD domain protein [Saccharofermentanales bacterium]|jgi:DnaD/phage-associated family protein